MKLVKQCARAARYVVLAAVLTAFGCPGDDEFGLYCSLMALVAGADFDFDACYDYNPGEYAAHRVYFADVRAYQGLVSQKSISGPAAPSFDVFMSARYPDWTERAEALRASMPVAAVQATPAADR